MISWLHGSHVFFPYLSVLLVSWVEEVQIWGFNPNPSSVFESLYIAHTPHKKHPNHTFCRSKGHPNKQGRNSNSSRTW